MNDERHTERRVPLSDFDRSRLLSIQQERQLWKRLSVAGLLSVIVLYFIFGKSGTEVGVFLFFLISCLVLLPILFVQIEKLEAIQLELEHQTTLVVEGVLERRVTPDDEGNEVITFHLGPYPVGDRYLGRKLADGDHCTARLAVYCGAVYSVEKK